MSYHAGQQLRVTESGDLAVIWDAAPGPGNYWAHLLPGRELVRLHVRHQHHEPLPTVTIVKDWE